MAESSSELTSILRGRILRGLHAGTVERGSRLPSAREQAMEFAVDSRVVLAAYRELAAEGLIEIRERGGVYVRGTEGVDGRASAVPLGWLAEVLSEGLSRGIAAPDLADCLARMVQTVSLKALVISSTEDQLAGLVRELRDDFGLEAEGVLPERLGPTQSRAPIVRGADLLICTAAQAALAESLGHEFDKPVIVIEVRPDLVAGEWAMLLREPVWAIVATVEFGEILNQFFRNVSGSENLRILVHGRDDLGQIPPDAPTYVTQRVRDALGVTPIRGRILPPARTISTASARRILDYVVRANFNARQAISRTRVTARG